MESNQNEIQVVTKEMKDYEIKNNNNFKQEKVQKTKLSIISAILLVVQVIMFLFQFKKLSINFLGLFPFIITSLILAIISKCKYNDKLSFIIIIIDCVILFFTIIVLILFLIFIVSMIESVLKGCSGNI